MPTVTVNTAPSTVSGSALTHGQIVRSTNNNKVYLVVGGPDLDVTSIIGTTRAGGGCGGGRTVRKTGRRTNAMLTNFGAAAGAQGRSTAIVNDRQYQILGDLSQITA